MKSNYELYINEREGKEIIETEKGFMTYYFDQDSAFIGDTFTRKEYRGTGVAKDFYNKVTDIAKSHNCDYLVSQVDTETEGWTLSKTILEGQGFNLEGVMGSLVFYSKELYNGK